MLVVSGGGSSCPQTRSLATRLIRLQPDVLCQRSNEIFGSGSHAAGCISPAPSGQ